MTENYFEIAARHPRGFLHGLPDNVVAVVNGRHVTREDILHRKRERQERRLALKRRPGPVWKPAYVWVFFNPGFAFFGWWLYIRTLRSSHEVRSRAQWEEIMTLWPCGVLPIYENRYLWCEQFAGRRHRPPASPARISRKVMCRALIAPGRVLDIRRLEVTE